ncbi:type IX secretion system membrane protein PorP/SprF [Siphonobacter sp. SORGH_AS_0500]|uniref:PorP/SprF family type IX secretion system membrane protein n=1 Tax=Siphonobacter sp. SORGH_AS_0500 TaxID=1864824 RepID=UPI000CB27879|nr:type IX secretion system membrane protein PorP/SprF [Siphonobacter sp. SORGH_AS_0500]MDR6193547.1 type IX secretion system PorP/SprF family membrane protein [Siphonobacter sp. SORGH_AS_0500]PKK36407.1 hypothetical protein BWI96_11125 [Siphonobacter sp. SORGH_AS_0500]
MKHSYWFLLLFLGNGIAQAQQRAQYSQYMLNAYVLNPAVSGLEDFIDAKVGYRNQWSGLEGAPKTFYATAHGALDKADRTSSLAVRGPNGRPLPRPRVFRSQPAAPGHHGIGGMVLYDEMGPTYRTSLTISYARHIPLNNRIKLSAGLGTGVTQHTIDFDRLHLLDPSDPVLQYGKQSVLMPDLSAGVLLYDPHFYVGLSASQLLFKNIHYRTSGQSAYEWLGTLYNHYFLTAGYRFDVTEDWAFLPSLLVKSVRPVPLSYDVNAKFSYQDRIWAGLSYRHKDAIVGLVGVNINYQINLGYSYDFTMSNLRNVSRGTHEIVIGIMLNNRQRIICPRLF